MQTGASADVPPRVPAGATPEGDGIVLGEGPVRVDAYIDFLCPFCRMFEERSGHVLDRLLDIGAVSLVYHPLGFLDRLSTTRYSTRASAASGCASDFGRFRPYKDALFANQPPEGGPGLSQERLIELGAVAGVDDPGFPACVAGGVHLPWSEYVTRRALERGVSGTPSVFVAGIPVPANGVTIEAAVAEIARESLR
jgi:protein-disulfide isomerase